MLQFHASLCRIVIEFYLDSSHRTLRACLETASRIRLRDALISVLKRAYPVHTTARLKDSEKEEWIGSSSGPLLICAFCLLTWCWTGIASCMNDIILQHGPRIDAEPIERKVPNATHRRRLCHVLRRFLKHFHWSTRTRFETV